MYLFETLKDADRSGWEISEFRLLCSGVLYNGRVHCGDWTKSDICRLLISDPITLMAVSYPAADYPQELMLRIAVPQVEEKRQLPRGGGSSRIWVPHAEVAADFAALLTLLLRRLITVHAQVSVQFPAEARSVTGFPFDIWPMPIFRTAARVAWGSRPPSFIYRIGAPPEVIGYSVAPLGVDVTWLRELLLKLPTFKAAPLVLACARLYGEAMQVIEERPEVAYQLFIAAAETLASASVPDLEPPAEEKARIKHNVSKRAQSLGMSEGDSKELAILSTEGMTWTGFKFRECLKRYVDDAVWERDDVFILDAKLIPERKDLDSALRKIYRARGAVVHSGHRFPASIQIGTTSTIPWDALDDIRSGDLFPPVTWFERVVQTATIRFLQEALNISPARPAV